ncbi:MAG: hypothetical protein ABEJ99_03840 [Candidatus Nanohaloarchaea archaeon]
MTDEQAETYRLTYETRDNYSEFENNPFLNKKRMVNLTATMICGIVKKAAYNYTGLKQLNDKMQEQFGKDNSRTPNDNKIPKKIFEEYTATSAEATFYNTDRSKKLAECRPDKNSLNLKLLVE